MKPIFVCGSMRGGTSLLQRVVCLSPDVNPYGPGARYLMEQMRLFVRFTGTDSLYVEEFFGGREAFRSLTQDLVDRILNQAWTAAGRPPGLVLKSPELTSLLPQTAGLLGDAARYVVSVREPKDTIASMIRAGERQRAAGVGTMLSRLGRDIDGLCRVYNGTYLPLLRALENAASPLRERVLFTKYEELVADPERIWSRVAGHCGIAPAPIPTDGSWRVGRAVGLFADHPRWRTYQTTLSGQPISGASVGNHRAVLDPADAARIDRACHPIRERFGYG